MYIFYSVILYSVDTLFGDTVFLFNSSLVYLFKLFFTFNYPSKPIPNRLKAYFDYSHDPQKILEDITKAINLYIKVEGLEMFLKNAKQIPQHDDQYANVSMLDDWLSDFYDLHKQILDEKNYLPYLMRKSYRVPETIGKFVYSFLTKDSEIHISFIL